MRSRSWVRPRVRSHSDPVSNQCTFFSFYVYWPNHSNVTANWVFDLEKTHPKFGKNAKTKCPTDFFFTIHGDNNHDQGDTATKFVMIRWVFLIIYYAHKQFMFISAMTATLGQGQRNVGQYINSNQYFLCLKYLRSSWNVFMWGAVAEMVMEIVAMNSKHKVTTDRVNKLHMGLSWNSIHIITQSSSKKKKFYHCNQLIAAWCLVNPGPGRY